MHIYTHKDTHTFTDQLICMFSRQKLESLIKASKYFNSEKIAHLRQIAPTCQPFFSDYNDAHVKYIRHNRKLVWQDAQLMHGLGS